MEVPDGLRGMNTPCRAIRKRRVDPRSPGVDTTLREAKMAVARGVERSLCKVPRSVGIAVRSTRRCGPSSEPLSERACESISAESVNRASLRFVAM